eukprot:TRINITY_DN7784_c0_g1_i1.p1 TRINITY_DN7784_c0_g1~~TRINITY_DN7784_c0_g1_i1.p1  ORF type:complete len:168 (+),score=45.01 TRINITY_DN7784_c0_g1_i1:20-523(+)
MSDNNTNGDEDNELQELKRKVEAMQREAEILQNMQEPEAKKPVKTDKKDADSRSVYVGNVDYGSTPEELQEHFNSCGTINRITILCDKYTGHPKGFAYVEFSDSESAKNALELNDSTFRGRQLKVTIKRTNVPGVNGRGAPLVRPGFPIYKRVPLLRRRRFNPFAPY